MQNGKVVVYTSCQLKVHEVNYSVQDLELATVSFELKLRIHYLDGDTFRIINNHMSLKYLMEHKELNSRERHWVELLKDYNCVIDYQLRTANVVVDALSMKERLIDLLESRSLGTKLEEIRSWG